LLNWHAGSNFGWGIVGLNIFLHWANDPDIRPLMGHPITREAIGPIDPLRLRRASAAIDYSNRFVAGIRPAPDGRRNIDAIVIDALGNRLPQSTSHGSVNVARCIFESADLSRAREALSKYDALLTASRWNAEHIEQATGRAAKVIFEGVDPSLFCPGPKSGLMDGGRFHIFSGGKVEFRKGQDLVLLAFKKFSARRKDCVLVTAWHSLWPRLSVGFKGKLRFPVETGAHGMLDIMKWVSQNGIDPRSVIDLGFVPNPLLPAVLREMDVALQPSRAEACTNLPVKEAMACGVPVIAAANTGMNALLTHEHSIAHEKQLAIDDPNQPTMDGWTDTDVEEIVAALEFAYEHRDEARQIGARSREWLIAHDRTWKAHASALKSWLLSMRS
jgi:glycosyltransferase involved in cell wall biosynthesis